MNFEMSATEHVMLSSGQRSSLCHPYTASCKSFPGASIKFQEISSISRSCRHPVSHYSALAIVIAITITITLLKDNKKLHGSNKLDD